MNWSYLFRANRFWLLWPRVRCVCVSNFIWAILQLILLQSEHGRESRVVFSLKYIEILLRSTANTHQPRIRYLFNAEICRVRQTQHITFQLNLIGHKQVKVSLLTRFVVRFVRTASKMVKCIQTRKTTYRKKRRTRLSHNPQIKISAWILPYDKSKEKKL